MPYDFNVDFSPLASLPKLYREAQQQAQRDAALEQFRQNPNMPFDQVARTLIGGGAITEGATLAGLQNQALQRALQERQIAESERHNRVGEGHQAATLAESVRQHNTTPMKAGADLSGDVYAIRDPSGNLRRIDTTTLPAVGEVRPIGQGGGVESILGGAPDTTKPQRVAQTGDEFLKTIPPQMQPLIKGVANYEIAPTTFSNRGQRERVLAAAKQYDPSFDETDYGNRFLTKRRFSSGPQGDTLRSMNVGIDHLATLQEYADALHNGDVRLINAAKAKFQQQFGYDAPTSFDAVKDIVGSEVSKAIVGSRGALEDRQEIKKNLVTAASPSQLSGVIRAYKKLMAGQVRGLQQQYESTGLKDFGNKLLPSTAKELGVGGTEQPGTERPNGVVNWQSYFGK